MHNSASEGRTTARAVTIHSSVGRLLVLGAALLLAACGGSSSDGDSPPPPPSTYSIGGGISGLNATGLVLQNNAGDNLTVAVNATSFQFATPMTAGSDYNVTVATQPAGLTCTVSHGAGTNINAAVTDISVICSANTHTIAGTISGLSTGGLVLRNNGADDLTPAANATSFQFTTPVAAGSGYSVTAFSQPAGLICTINNGVGSNVSTDINSVGIVCSATTFTVGGTISGLTASGLVLQNNAGDNLSIAASATQFQFATPIAYGSGYQVTVLTQPSGQSCSLTGATGTNVTAQIDDVAINCAETALTASVSSLALSVDCSAAAGNCVHANAALTGNAREITITNTSATAMTTALTVTPALFPAGTSITNDNCSGLMLASSSSCSIVITPGQEASSGCTAGTPPTPGTVTVNASSAPAAIVTDVVVLGYGCIYQGGFVYSIDDTTTTNGSIAGKVAAIYDVHTGGFITGDPNWGGVGVDVGSSSWDTDSIGANDGRANTTVTTDALGCTPSTSPSYAACLCTNLSVDAAGSACTPADTCYTNWYLPAICELAPLGSICTAGGTNMQEQLYNASPAITANFVDGGFYWSSTEFTGYPTNTAWYQYFSNSGSSQGAETKDLAFSVRCSRALTQ